MTRFNFFLAVCLATFLAAFPAPATVADEAKDRSHSIIDVHAHLVGKPQSFRRSLKTAKALMDRYGFKKLIISSPPKLDSNKKFDFTHLKALVDGKKRFSFLGGGSSLNAMLHRHENIADIPSNLPKEFADTAQSIVDAGAAGFGEISALHISLQKGHRYEFQPADHPLLLNLADISARSGLPIDIHMDAVFGRMDIPEELMRNADNPPSFPGTLKSLKRLLQHNRKSKIVWAHGGSDPLGEMSAGLIGSLMDKYETLYVSLRIQEAGGIITNTVFDGDSLDSDWLALLKRHSGRFVIGTDSFFVPAKLRGDAAPARFAKNSETTMELTGRFLSMLPAGLSRKIARENAIRIYNLRGRGSAGSASEAGGGRKSLSEADIRKAIIGNTLSFKAPSSGKSMYVYFANDGRAIMRIAGRSKKITKKWFFNPRGMLCRTYGKQNKRHCTRVKTSGASETYLLFNKRVRYQATLHKGAKFSK